MIDLHSHILPGVDDGPDTVDGSLEMAREAVADGIRLVAATPHVRRDWPTTPDVVEREVERLRAALGRAGIPLEIRTGAELAHDRLAALPAEELRRFGLGGNPRVLLIETPYYGWPAEFGDRVFFLRASGFTPVIAHPERNREVQNDPERVRALVDGGALVQLTAASLDGRVGKGSRACALRLLDLGLAHLVASDAHEPHIRRVGLSGVAAQVDDQALARWLTEDVPRALVDGAPLPDRPPRARRGWIDRIRAGR